MQVIAAGLLAGQAAYDAVWKSATDTEKRSFEVIAA